ncbi:exodeoxyribonuclease V subunit alpha [Pseudoxanthomonas indica]|uniref:RecBCD enzyme subunit RecD n=1 Tax=Pseudoxanthomonas indica TaxID=428993 RepID=A0A1T5KP52_9GAMM|nr:exodeoxyribonuclease V subunit alpha [Pseudoxanthomonas indica]GGD50542.1 RecBCD enzyme subunit RecD [Pseudoxanthomonas indica]SKC65450.1 DNA helicase/exodeoxyribonuclease V, alpha subunit [Pseudoxanthomonas indica]
MSLFDQLWRAGALRTLDHALAQSLRRLRAETTDSVLVAAALASLAVAQGNAGFDPAAPASIVEGEFDWPSADTWLAELTASPWVTTPAVLEEVASEAAPLVLENGLVYLRRYREYERRLASGLQRIAASAPATTAITTLAPLFAQLFPSGERSTDRQAQAAALALRHNLLLITGGPGTGKTTTITRLLVLLAAQAQQDHAAAPRIALAAPTGRAAERMAESLRRAREVLQNAPGMDAELIAALPASASTLHRLLGTIPDSPRFRHDADNPLAFDVIVIDEASMVDLPLMTKLVEAVPDGARLILLGDPDQLPSVEAGDVLAAILRAAGSGEGLPADDAEALSPLLGTGAPVITATSGFAGRRLHLQTGYRQHAGFDLAPLAQAVREGDAARSLSLLRRGELHGVHFHEDASDPLQRDGDPLLAHWQALATQSDPVQALHLASQLRLLTAVREGPQGARGLNARIEARLLGQRGGIARAGDAPGSSYFAGRLLQITENSYRHRLFNGDIGVCLRDADGVLVAWFPGGEEGSLRAFHPATLPAHESAFAMTVHKAQGSEFDAVWLVLPAHGNRVLSRELIYTGITRAKRELHVLGSEAVIREALGRHASRVSGLQARL